jgi:aryl-alcohol dehydrogenase
MRITAAVVDEVDGPFTITDLELDEPAGDEVLVRVVASGVCHTDALARHGDLPFPLPGVLGHEGAGVVEAVGDRVAGFGPGDRVVIGWPYCGTCKHCRGGQPRYCVRLGELIGGGTRLGGVSALHRADGTAVSGHFFGQSSFATHALTSAAALVPVPDGLPLAALGPLACGIATGAGAVFNTVRPEAGTRLAVFGAGAVGLAAIMAARNSPATRIIAVDRHESRLRLALELGATHVVNSRHDDPVEAINDICGGPVDYTLECTGVISVVRQAADCVGMLGTCLLIGGAPAGAEFTLDHVSTMWGKRVIGVLGGGGRGHELITGLLELHEQGRFPFDRLITYFDLADIEEALDRSAAGDVIKPVLRMP